jgi:hypothetical protein
MISHTVEHAGSGGTYDEALICTNGHVINSAARTLPVHSAGFCSKCGAQAVEKCARCDTKIRGYYSHAGLLHYHAPAYCHTCGTAYPWTETRLQAARDLVLETEGLTEDERRALERSLDDLVKDTPRSVLAVTRFKTLMTKAGATVATGFRDILVDIVSETVKKSLWP